MVTTARSYACGRAWQRLERDLALSHSSSTDAEWLALLGGFRLQARVSTTGDLDWTANCGPSKRVAGPLEDPSGAARGADAGRHITAGYTCGL